MLSKNEIIINKIKNVDQYLYNTIMNINEDERDQYISEHIINNTDIMSKINNINHILL